MGGIVDVELKGEGDKNKAKLNAYISSLRSMSEGETHLNTFLEDEDVVALIEEWCDPVPCGMNEAAEYVNSLSES